MLKFLAIGVVLLFSCGNENGMDITNNESVTNNSASILTETSDSIPKTEIPNEEISNHTEENGILIEFQDFKMQIDTLEIWNESNTISATNDTAHVMLGLGFGIEGNRVKVYSDKNLEFNIYQRYETSITIMNEGPHCDLNNWKHYYSDWKKINVSNNRFIADSYNIEERETFLEVNMKEVQVEVQKQCGDRWSELLDGVNSVDEYPCGVGISCIYFKIVYSPVDSDISTTKFVAFEVPMGC